VEEMKIREKKNREEIETTESIGEKEIKI